VSKIPPFRRTVIPTKIAITAFFCPKENIAGPSNRSAALPHNVIVIS
jgi:hypothetical protein